MSRRLADAATAVWCYAALANLDARRSIPPLQPGARPTATPTVSVLVPARDEARDLPATISSLLALDWPALEVVVVDDESADMTWSVIAAAAASDARLRGVRGAPLPAGWVGKQWALDQGVRVATGEWLLFSDADVQHAPQSLAAALALAESAGAAGVSAAPLVETSGRAERILTGAALLSICAFVAPPFLVRQPAFPVALAAGGHILVRRDAYERAGGHAAVRNRMIDDVAIAELLKRHGTPLLLAGGGGLVRVRMYASLGEALLGWRKSAAHGLRGRRLPVGAGALALATGALLPPLALLLGVGRRDRRLAVSGVAGWIAMAAARQAGSRLCPAPAGELPFVPLGLVGLAGVALRSVYDRSRGGATWRGRRYPTAV